MKRITTVLKACEALEVRRAVLTAGANRVVLFPINRRAELVDWHCGSALREDHVRIEVTAEDSRSDGILSAIMNTAHVGKIEAITAPCRKAA